MPSLCTLYTCSMSTHDGRPCASHGARADGQEVPVPVVCLARQPDRVHAIGGLPADDEHRPILAAAVVLGVRHPRPDDLAGVGIAVPVGRVRDLQTSAAGWGDLDRRGGAGAAGLVPLGCGVRGGRGHRRGRAG